MVGLFEILNVFGGKRRIIVIKIVVINKMLIYLRVMV